MFLGQEVNPVIWKGDIRKVPITAQGRYILRTDGRSLPVGTLCKVVLPLTSLITYYVGAVSLFPS